MSTSAPTQTSAAPATAKESALYIWGDGTAMPAFFRSLGGLIGVTGSGAMLAQQLHGQTATAAL